ncbi:hypothetical protein WOLCODRAFT_157969 [Wolfiporia cocos MD-104 SS10]|uniref:Uncharacterized protein n=1 Tax=Wolfiporia cocos (strain MD-104) TaxID=742152 RepID=A0A2H3JKU2_WOLCO|nr:hypothetical protein WOLCODRAFT_157969 [Wolfiporia cocos MD-104 SS10]
MRPDRPCQGSARVSASKREVTQHLPGHRPCNQPRTAAPPALPTVPLDWTTPSCTLPRAPTRKGGPTCGGSPLRPRPSSGQRSKHLGSKRNGAPRPPRNKTRQPTGRVFTQRARRHPPPSIDPSRNPAHAIIERGAASAQAIPAAHALGGCWTSESKTRTPPDPSGSDKAIPAKRSRASGRPYGKGNRPSHTTQPQATATDPPAYSTQGRAKAHSRQGNPPRTKSNGSAACLNNRATLSAGRVNQGAQQASRKAASRPRGGTHQHPSRPGNVESPYANGKPLEQGNRRP